MKRKVVFKPKKELSQRDIVNLAKHYNDLMNKGFFDDFVTVIQSYHLKPNEKKKLNLLVKEYFKKHELNYITNKELWEKEQVNRTQKINEEKKLKQKENKVFREEEEI